MSTKLDDIISFHGHMCPGLAIGIRASEYAQQQIGVHSKDEEIVCITETDMCGVDAIQYMIGCTFGKGNLIFQDHGKVAFSFLRRSDGKSIRLTINPNFPASSEDREKRIEEIMNAHVDSLFKISNEKIIMPKTARIFDSVICEECSEKVMEPKIRLLNSKKICIPCFEKEILKR